MLKRMNQPKPSLCDRLITRLEGRLQGVTTPDSANPLPQHHIGCQPDLDTHSWQIFDQVSLQQFDYLAM